MPSAQPQTPKPVLAVLDQHGRPRVLPLETPVLPADDSGAIRGEGVFETTHIRGEQAWLLDAHLDRLATSAERLALTLPPRKALADLVKAAVLAWNASGHAGVDAGVRLTCTPGGEEGPPVSLAMTFAVPAASIAARRDGVRVCGLQFGYPSMARADAPWLMGGVKSLSYAVNRAMTREALARGFDDAVLISSDGVALEGPTSALLWMVHGELVSTPFETGVLPSITLAHLFSRVGELGLTARFDTISHDALSRVEGAWLASSARGLVPVTAVDEHTLPISSLTPAMQRLLGFATPA